MARNINIYEVEYSCSPGGVDKWEIEEEGGDYFKAPFDTADANYARSNRSDQNNTT